MSIQILDNTELKDRLTEKVRSKISEYLTIDINKLLSAGDSVYVFGGAVRDAIAGTEIHDVDIIASPLSCTRLTEILDRMGFKRIESVSGIDISSMYTGAKKIINEPLTYVKHLGLKNPVVQVIRPCLTLGQDPPAVVRRLIRNVDLTCCGVSLNSHFLEEHVKGAIVDCLNWEFSVNVGADMVTERLSNRKSKLMLRGWKHITENNKHKEN